MESEPDIDRELPKVDETVADAQVEAVQDSASDNSAGEDAVLDRLLGIDAPAPRQATRTPEPSAPANDPDYDRALKALQRDGVPASVIDGMKTDPSALKDWGLKALKRQADVDAFGAKVAKAKADATETPKATEEAKQQASSETNDGEADADPLSEFGEIFGDEAAKPIRSFADRLRSEFDAKAKALEVKYETQAAYSRIATQYGKDAPSFDDITEVAARVGRENPGAFTSINEIVEEAFRQRAGSPKRVDPRNIARPNVGKTPPRPVREVDREDVILDVLLSGGTRNDALKAATR